MRLLPASFGRFFIVLTISALLVSGCSSSSPSESQSPVDNASTGEDAANAPVNDGVNGGANTPALTKPADNSSVVNPEPLNTENPEPPVQTFTKVDFDITVTPYVSDALQVRVAWDDNVIASKWVGDEQWSATAELPRDTMQSVTVTFFDDNGGTTLASWERVINTGANDLLVLVINANDFDYSWDTDGDGVSNIDEARTEPFEATRILLFSETRDFRHDSTETALAALEEIASSAGIQADRAADSAGLFTDENLANYNAVIWVMTSGDVLDAVEQAAFERFIRAGGGYAGIHAASFTEYEWPWYGNLVGAYFDSHPAIQSASQNVEDGTHQSTAHLDLRWTRTDEWYDYRTNPRGQVNVLLSLDEDSYTGGTMGDDHPSAWFHDYDGGRSWYTGGGHTVESYAEPDFRTHLLGGLRYAAGIES